MLACDPAPAVLRQPGRAQENPEPSNARPERQPHLPAPVWERLPEPGGHRGAGARLTAVRGSLGPRGRRRQLLLLKAAVDPAGSRILEVATLKKSLGFGARGQGRAESQVLGSTDPVYTASRHRIRDAEPRKIHRAAVGATPGRRSCLARRSGDPDARDKPHRSSYSCTTALHLACAEVVTLLVNRKCQVDICDKQNRTTLIQAVHCQKETWAIILLKHGTNPHLKDIYGITALHYAGYNESILLAEKLLSCDANIEAMDKV
ncbi:putative ankyrin repeat domain-containing protein 20A5 [Aotus nancymaae]|uniref:putative ankyrin repeat domain-containing protein 20A5 n=1 Tax=Aotus nancymaae TaxID=37293 RepID=UPI0030FE7A4D